MDRSASEVGQRSLAQRIAAAPQLWPAGDGHARVADWLAEIASTDAGRMIARRLHGHPALAQLIAGLAEGSPYLWDLARAAPERLAGLLDSEPEARFDAILADGKAAVAAARDEAQAMRALRRMKTEAALLIALADIGGVWPIMHVI